MQERKSENEKVAIGGLLSVLGPSLFGRYRLTARKLAPDVQQKHGSDEHEAEHEHRHWIATTCKNFSRSVKNIDRIDISYTLRPGESSV